MLDNLRDIKAKVAVTRQIDRIVIGNFGNHKPLRDGLYELKIDVGQGYRVYYSQYASNMLVLLCGGDKQTQEEDIKKAISYRNSFMARIK